MVKDEAETKAKADVFSGSSWCCLMLEEVKVGLVSHLEGLFDMPALAPHKHLLQPLFDLLDQHESLIFGIIAAPLLLLLASLGLLGGSKGRSTWIEYPAAP